tara:strand:+ start:1229 stop:1402 length:174 start_codon:yes stop_codon:yes gene_type:complete
MRIFDSREVTATAKLAVFEDEPNCIHPEIPGENAFICKPESGLTKRLATWLIRFLNA